MTTLLLVELRRDLARRLTRILVLLAVVGIAVAGVLVFVNHTGTAPSVTPLPGPPGQDLGFFVRDPRFHLRELPGILRGTTVPLVLLAWVLGASFIGAEWRAGTVSTQLTWEPRRVRLLVTKSLAAVIVAFALTIALQLVLCAALLPSALWRGTTEGLATGEVAGVLLRGAALAGMAGAVGFSVGSIGRNTSAALGAGFVYLAVLEGGLLGGIFPGIRRWLIVGNSAVFMTGQEIGDIFGRSVAGAGIVLVSYATALVAIAAAVFRRRDVT